MARIEDLELDDEPIGDGISLDDLPTPDPNFDRPLEWVGDRSWISRRPEGVTGEPGASLPVPNTESIH